MSRPGPERKNFVHRIGIALMPPPPSLELVELWIDPDAGGEVEETRHTILALQARIVDEYSARPGHEGDTEYPTPIHPPHNSGWRLDWCQVGYSCLFFDNEYGIVPHDDDELIGSWNTKYLVLDTSKPEASADMKAKAIQRLQELQQAESQKRQSSRA